MNCFKKELCLLPLDFRNWRIYIIPKFKSRVDDLEEEIWGMEDYELEACPYCDRVYTMEYETYDGFTDNIEQAKVEEVKSENCNNELHDEVQNYLEHVEEEKNKYDKDKK